MKCKIVLFLLSSTSYAILTMGNKEEQETARIVHRLQELQAQLLEKETTWRKTHFEARIATMSPEALIKAMRTDLQQEIEQIKQLQQEVQQIKKELEKHKKEQLQKAKSNAQPHQSTLTKK